MCTYVQNFLNYKQYYLTMKIVTIYLDYHINAKILFCSMPIKHKNKI